MVRSGLDQEKGHVQQRHGFIDATLSSLTGITRRPPQCCCLTLVSARRMLLRWLNYNVLIHIDCNIDLYANRSLLTYMEFLCKIFVIVYVTFFVFFVNFLCISLLSK